MGRAGRKGATGSDLMPGLVCVPLVSAGDSDGGYFFLFGMGPESGRDTIHNIIILGQPAGCGLERACEGLGGSVRSGECREEPPASRGLLLLREADCSSF